MRGKRGVLVLVLLPFVLGAVAFAGFRLQEELGEAGSQAQCITDPKDLEGPNNEPAPRSPPPLCPGVIEQPRVCQQDPKTGLPLPGSDPMCPPVPVCPTCPFPFTPEPSPDLGPFKPNPAAVLPAPPVHRVGDAAALGRTDCPAGWQALVSDTTGMSVCFPPDATLYGPSPETGSWGWGSGGEWDEAVIAVLPEGRGDVTVHRIGSFGGGSVRIRNRPTVSRHGFRFFGRTV